MKRRKTYDVICKDCGGQLRAEDDYEDESGREW